ncbi:hypothetical protein [Paenibacillus luteus]|uniref:hypothetical protein n=1 Tax=Paenibacillus luteus TaxID=2545753 RepID=UPI0011444359|nr:hypothetical protein [Paenibacillus luteus]
MKETIISYLFPASWIMLVYIFLSDYDWYQQIAIGTWGFLGVNALTLFPILLSLFITDRVFSGSKQSKPSQESRANK